MRRLRTGLLTSSLLVALVAGHADAATAPKVKLTAITASGSTVTVKGRVERLPTAKRAKARVAITLTDAKGVVEKFSATPKAGGAFSGKAQSKLSGALTVRARLTLAGKKTGKLVTKADAVRIGEAADTAATVLSGAFKLDPGIRQPDGIHTGTWFQMLPPNGGAPLQNSSSGSTDKNFTTLPPGLDGGLKTFGFQGAPAPGFAPDGDSLADRIITPQDFLDTKFGIVTDAVDAQTGTADPLPRIVNTNGKLSGQLTAFVAQWNNQSFNQGTPKPDGTLPGTTTPLTGTYDAATQHFVLSWKSLIVGGPFNSFTGSWHLEGTFVPQ